MVTTFIEINFTCIYHNLSQHNFDDKNNIVFMDQVDEAARNSSLLSFGAESNHRATPPETLNDSSYPGSYFQQLCPTFGFRCDFCAAHRRPGAAARDYTIRIIPHRCAGELLETKLL